MNLLRLSLLAAATCAAFAPLAQAANVPLPNFSFETPNLTGTAPYYVEPGFEGPGIFGDWKKQTGSPFIGIVVGGRYGVSPTGLDGFQFGNVNAATNAGMLMDTVAFGGGGNPDLYWQANKTYKLTLGFFRRSDNAATTSAVLDMRFYYRDFDFGPRTVLATTSITGASTTTNSLTDFNLSFTVPSNSPAIGKPIGIWFTPSNNGGAPAADWAMDNARLDVVPEPASGLLGLAGAVCLLRRRRA